jgi:hypothetical protein
MDIRFFFCAIRPRACRNPRGADASVSITGDYDNLIEDLGRALRATYEESRKVLELLKPFPAFFIFEP